MHAWFSSCQVLDFLARAGLKLKEQCQLALAKDLAKLKCFFALKYFCTIVDNQMERIVAVGCVSQGKVPRK